MTQYEKTNEELCAYIRQMRDTIDPKLIERYDQLVVQKLQEMEGQLRGEYHTRIIES